MIEARGVAGLTFRAVAEAAGVGLGVVTYYFPNRRALLGAAFRLHLDQMHERGGAFEALAGPAWKDGSLSVDALADAIVAFLASMAREDRASVIASHELSLEMTRDADLTREVDSAVDVHHRDTADLVARATGAGSSDEDAAIVSAVFDQLTLGWVARPDDDAYAARVHRIVRRVVERILVPAQAPASGREGG